MRVNMCVNMRVNIRVILDNYVCGLMY
jgi:hypothetical protein